MQDAEEECGTRDSHRCAVRKWNAEGGARTGARCGNGRRDSGKGPLCSRFPDYLLEGRDALQDLEPAVHAERQHAVLDRAVLDLGRADVLQDQLPELRRHEHDFVETLTALEPGAVALLAACALEERYVA